jgi:hypothetical protein
MKAEERRERKGGARLLTSRFNSQLSTLKGASQFLAELFFSLAPGFSRVNRARRKWKRFQPFSAPATTKPLKRLGAASPAPTGLKPGANERLQESEKTGNCWALNVECSMFPRLSQSRHLPLATWHTLAQNFPMPAGFHATFARVKELVAIFTCQQPR